MQDTTPPWTPRLAADPRWVPGVGFGAMEASGVLERRSVVVGGRERSYLVCGAASPAGIVLCLHGSRSTASQQARFSGMGVLQRQRMVVAFPQAAVPLGRGFEWDHEADVPYLAAVIDELRG